MSEIKLIEQREVLGKDFRIYDSYENPLFLAKDVAEWIEHNKPAEMLQGIDYAEKLKAIISHSGQNREMWFLTEDGLYEVLMQSRKPIAKQFKTKVKEILKDVRKHGMYVTPEKIMEMFSEPTTIITVLSEYRDEKERRQKAEQQLEQVAQQLEEQKPLVEFTETVLKSKDNILVRELSKIIQDEGIDIGEKKLYSKLRDWGLILKKKTEPAQRYMNEGLFVVDENPVITANGIFLNKRTRVTPKGQLYIINKLKKELAG